MRIVSRRAQGDHGSATQAEHVAGSIDEASTIERAVDGATAVVNLIGTTAAKREQEFYALHRDAPRRLAEAARRASVKRLVHVSAMGIAPDAPSIADRSKAAGENAVREAFPDANLIRPPWYMGQAITFSHDSRRSSAMRRRFR